MTTLRFHRPARRAAIAPFAAVLLVPLLAMVAFAVDLGWIAQVQGDLQNAADASALAGAGQLMNGFVQYNATTSATQQYAVLNQAESGAKSTAKTVAGLNAADVSSLTLLDSDIEFGFTNAAGSYTASTPTSGYPNTVKVTLRRDSSANGALGLFFGPVLGVSTMNLQATAAATIYTARVNSFNNTPTGLLPVTYDVQHWNNFLLTGLSPNGSMSTDSGGNPTLNVYATNTGGPGNFGLLSLDDSHVGSSTIRSWVDYGMTPSDLSDLKSGGPNSSTSTALIPLSQHDSGIQPNGSDRGSWNWQGDTGMQQDVVSTIGNYAGDTFLLPLYKAYNSSALTYEAGVGHGANYFYNIVDFVAVKIVSTGTHTVTVEPSAKVLDFNNFDLITQPAGTYTAPAGGSSQLTTFVPPKLTQ
jgi:Flp pilus assembly protein TadG